MEKNAIRFWRCFGPILVLLELVIYFFLFRDTLLREIAALAFFALNTTLVARRSYVKTLVDKHNAQVDADMAAKQAMLSKAKVTDPTPARAIAKKGAPAAADAPPRSQAAVPVPAIA